MKCTVTRGLPVSMTEKGWQAICKKTRAAAIEAKKKSGGKNATVCQQYRLDSDCLNCDQAVPPEVTFITLDGVSVARPISQRPAARPTPPPVPVAEARPAARQTTADQQPAPRPEPKKIKKQPLKKSAPSRGSASYRPTSAAENARRIFLRNGCKWMTICALTRAFNQRFTERHSEMDVAKMLIDWQVLGKAVPSVSQRKGGRAR